MGTAAKFAAPTIARGNVYATTESGFTVFGLLS
jgi:hypothetical protein